MMNFKSNNKNNKNNKNKYRKKKNIQNPIFAQQLQTALNQQEQGDKQLKDEFMQKAKQVRKFTETTYPKIFDRKNFVPLKIGIHKDLLAKHPDIFETPQQLKYFIKNHTSQVGYSYAMLNSTHRLDLDGKECAEIADKEKQYAKQVCNEYNKMRRDQLLEMLYTKHPKCFSANFRYRKPLSEQVITQLINKYPDKPKAVLTKCLEYYKSNYSYYDNFAKSKFYIDLNGENQEQISAEQKQQAKEKSQAIKDKISSKNDPESKIGTKIENNTDKQTDIKAKIKPESKS